MRKGHIEIIGVNRKHQLVDLHKCAQRGGGDKQIETRKADNWGDRR